MSASIDNPSYPQTDIGDPGINDVMCGRGGGTNNHTGNKRFRMLVNEHKHRYIAATKLDKPKVAREVMLMWRKQEPPGRFLSRDSKTKMWNDVGDQKAREKASQCLRERRTPSDVLPFKMPGKKKKIQEQEEEESESDYDRSESEEEEVPEQAPKRKTLPRMQALERVHKEEMKRQQAELEKMQEEVRLQELKLQEMKMQQQQGLGQRKFPRQSVQQPVSLDAQYAHAQANTAGMALPPPPISSAPLNITHLPSPRGPIDITGMNQQQVAILLHMLGAGWDGEIENLSEQQVALLMGSMSLQPVTEDTQIPEYHVTTAKATAFRSDLNDKYGLSSFTQPQPNAVPSMSQTSLAIDCDMKSIEYDDMRSATSLRTMDGKSFTSHKSDTLKNLFDGSPSNSLRNLMKGMEDSDSIADAIMALQVPVQGDEHSFSHMTVNASRSRMSKMGSAKKMTSNKSVVSELTDLSAELVALDLSTVTD
mmetsp:Transcript_54396/g.80708  ORF Transcript_54396/g.80708 Transcript_54396/m.80708 type:complete len:479 (+) Transcript_54396:38-1474(+)|eukprot:CAMPEP_0195522102 /NCGR_PEP_ID=MMETSP0794_2-20130614/20038_1 /TAXON_ID=515487 /ORGANISM="Stephanopyxis turris, Strain CCMP 815" /LENGTH=478 /DNA_ID=CAMNT_0040651791 /DNA_START=38 /DNA_END=1474 /DNA_ORIENTATION=+